MAELRTLLLSCLCVHHIITWFSVIHVNKSTISEPISQKELQFLLILKNMGPRFLTIWTFQTAYIFLALLIQAIPNFKIKNEEYIITKLKKFNWYNFSTIVFPWSIFVPLLFWPVFLFNRELIFPKILDSIYPVWLNHALHTNIFALLFVEMIYTKQRPPKMQSSLKGLTIYAACYVATLVYTYFTEGVWLYKFIAVVNWPFRIIMFAGIYLIVLLFTYIGVTIQNWKYSSHTVNKNI